MLLFVQYILNDYAVPSSGLQSESLRIIYEDMIQTATPIDQFLALELFQQATTAWRISVTVNRRIGAPTVYTFQYLELTCYNQH